MILLFYSYNCKLTFHSKLRKTFHNQQEEIRSLKNLLHQKDQRIQDLEDQVKRLKSAFRMNEPSSLAAVIRNGV